MFVLLFLLIATSVSALPVAHYYPGANPKIERVDVIASHPDYIAAFDPNRNVIILTSRASHSALLHEMTHYMIHLLNVDTSAFGGDEYVAYMVEAIDILSTDKWEKVQYGSFIFYDKDLVRYEAIFKVLFSR